MKSFYSKHETYYLFGAYLDDRYLQLLLNIKCSFLKFRALYRSNVFEKDEGAVIRLLVSAKGKRIRKRLKEYLKQKKMILKKKKVL